MDARAMTAMLEQPCSEPLKRNHGSHARTFDGEKFVDSWGKGDFSGAFNEDGSIKTIESEFQSLTEKDKEQD